MVRIGARPRGVDRGRRDEGCERIAAAHVDSPFDFAFAPAGTHARQLVRLEHATLRYGDAKPVFEGLELREAHALLENIPRTIKENASWQEAERIKS